MQHTIVYVLTLSEFDPIRDGITVQQVAAFHTPQDAIDTVESIYKSHNRIVLERDVEEDVFGAAWWLTDILTGQKSRLDLGKRDAYIGPPNLETSATVA